MRHRRRDQRRGLAGRRHGLIVWTETLAGREIERRVPGRATREEHGDDAGQELPLRAGRPRTGDPPVCRSRGTGKLRFNTEMTSFSQKPDGVTGMLTDRATGAETPFTARYLIAAEGAQSAVRRALGVKMIGVEKIYDSVNILFHADLTQWVEHRPAALYFVEQEDLRGTFLTINGSDRWGFLIHSPKQYGWKPQDFTPEFCAQLIRKAVGVPDLAGIGARRQPVGSLCHRRRPLSRRRCFPRRRCGPRDAADRRLRPEHRGAGRPQSGMENRRRAARQSR